MSNVEHLIIIIIFFYFKTIIVLGNCSLTKRCDGIRIKKIIIMVILLFVRHTMFFVF